MFEYDESPRIEIITHILLQLFLHVERSLPFLHSEDGGPREVAGIPDILSLFSLEVEVSQLLCYRYVN